MSPQKSFKKFNLNDSDAQLLKNQIITPISPGSIVKDFNSLLDYIQATRVELTASNNHFTQKHFEPMNQSLINPIQIKITRPRLRTYANLEGYYLLLRSTGIVKIVNSKKEKILQLNDKIFDGWQSLNPTEQYFSLFVTWLYRSEPQNLLGEYSHCRWPLLDKFIEFYTRLPEKGMKVDNNDDMHTHLTYLINFFNIALARAFGLISIQEGEPITGKGWRIMKILPTAIGNVMHQCLEQIQHENLMWDYLEHYEVPCCVWQPLFQSCFPKWQNSLTLPESEFREGVFVFKVSLGNVWRRIEIDSKMTLEQFADIILDDGFKFDNDHLYAFYYENDIGDEVEVGCPELDSSRDTTQQRIGDIPLPVGATMKFLFDFGDNWQFTILLEEIKTGKSIAKLPRITQKHGRSPKQYRNWDDEDF